MNKTIDKHGEFLVNIVVPLIHTQAKSTATEPLEVAVAVYCSMISVLRHHGVTADDLIAVIKESDSDFTAPEVLQ